MNTMLPRPMRWLALFLAAAALLAAQLSATAASAQARGTGGRGNAGGQALGPLSAAAVDALTEAIEEEYLAMNTYRAVVDQFGPLDPFERIARSEKKHADALARLFEKYGLPVPENPGLPVAPTWESAAAACQTGVDAEIADAALYDRLAPSVDHPDILRVFGNLQAASLENHLPAFESCN